MGPSLPWLLQPQSLSPLLLLSPMLMLILGTATDTVATDGGATTGPMATMATMERGLQMLSLSLVLLLSPLLMLIPGTATDIVAMDTADTTGLMATMAITERGLPMPSQSPLLLLSPMLMLIPGTAMDTVDTDGVATTGLMATMATTAHMDMGVTGEVTGAKQTNREVDSSSDCDFPSTLASISRACSLYGLQESD